MVVSAFKWFAGTLGALLSSEPIEQQPVVSVGQAVRALRRVKSTERRERRLKSIKAAIVSVEKTLQAAVSLHQNNVKYPCARRNDSNSEMRGYIAAGKYQVTSRIEAVRIFFNNISYFRLRYHHSNAKMLEYNSS